jgi:ABC-type multidrug transport system ATPase subunit
VWEAVRAHVQEGGSLLLTTHHLEEADALAERVVLIEGGRIASDGPLADLNAAAARRSSGSGGARRRSTVPSSMVVASAPRSRWGGGQGSSVPGSCQVSRSGRSRSRRPSPPGVT